MKMRSGPWFTAEEARVYTRRPTLRAWYEWRRRHGVTPNRSGLIAKSDLDLALSEQRPKRHMAQASLANLRQRSA